MNKNKNFNMPPSAAAARPLRGRSAGARFSDHKQHRKPISKEENNLKHHKTFEKRFEYDYANI